MDPAPLDEKIKNLKSLKQEINKGLRGIRASKEQIIEVDKAFAKIISQIVSYKKDAIKNWKNRKR